MKIYFLVIGIACSLLSACGPRQNPEESETRDEPNPNIIFILADDMGFGDLGSYGQSILTTPNIDRLAAQGIKFTNFYTGSTVCAPSRASLLTGLHTGHVSVRGNQPDQLLAESMTIAHLLKGEGYRTGVIGKWGVGHPPAPDDPQRNGFDYSYGYINMWHAHNFYPEFLYRNGQREDLPENKLIRNADGTRKYAETAPEGTGVAEVRGQHTHELFEQDALTFITDNKDNNFFLYLALNMPHANNEHPTNGMEVPGYGDFQDKDWPDPEKGFAMMMTMVDQTVGRIDSALIAMGISENTLLVFCSDNGPHQEGFHEMEFFNSNGSLRGLKRDFYDGGIKTPFIAKWPGKIKAGTSSGHLSAFWDILPTIADAVGKDKTGFSTDGISFLPTLFGQESEQEKHDYLYWEFYEFGGRQAVLKDNFKAVKLDVRTGNPKPIELYDLSNDPGELNDIAANHPEIVEAMQRRMDQSHTSLSFMSLFEMDVSADTPF